MLFEAMCDNLMEASNDFDLALMKVSAFYEAAQRESDITEAKAFYAYESDEIGAAEHESMDTIRKATLGERFIAAVKKIIEAIKEFFAKVRDKVVQLYRDSAISSVIAKAKKKLNQNPILRKKRCEPVPDYKEVLKKYLEEEKWLAQQCAKYASGNFDEDEFEHHCMSFTADMAVTKKKTDSIVTYALADLASGAQKAMDKFTARAKEVCSDIDKKVKSTKAYQKVDNSKLLKILKRKSTIVKEEAEYTVAVTALYIKKLAAAIKSKADEISDKHDARVAAREAKKAEKAAKKAQKSVAESATDIVDDYLDDMLSNINESSLYSDSDDYYESYDDSDFDFDDDFEFESGLDDDFGFDDYDDDFEFESSYDDYYDDDIDVDSILY